MARVEVESRAEEVTLFEDRAEVVRRAEVRLAPGLTTIVVRGIGLTVHDESLLVAVAGADGDGDGDGAAAARVIAARVVRAVRRSEAAGAEEVAALERAWIAAERRRLDGERAVNRAEAEVARVAALGERLWDSLARAPRGLREDGAGWSSAHGELVAARTRALAAAAAARRTLRDAVRASEQAGARLAAARAITPRFEATVETQVDVGGGEPRELALVLTYRVAAALWRPEHEARLLTDGDGGPRLRWRTMATIWQRTGERWTDVRCRLSTARPAQTAEPPLLDDDRLWLKRREEKQIAVEIREQAVALAGLDRGARKADEMPGVDDGGEPLTLTTARPVTLVSDGRPARVEIALQPASPSAEWGGGGQPATVVEIPCTVELVAWPERGQAAHLRATATWPGPYPLLAGPVRLGRDRAMVGRASVQFVGAGEPFELGFGPDDTLRVRRRVDDERDRGVLGGQKLDRTVTLFVSNVGGAPRRLALVERIPVSEISDIKIELTKNGGGALDARDGFVRLELEVAPGGTVERTLAWRIEAGSKFHLPF
jgi:uncharacterized protein (TIGR02231 family)